MRRRNNLPDASNRIFDLLPRKERTRLLAVSEPVQLVLREILCESGKPIRHVYFPTRSFVSLIAVIRDKPVLEVGMVGNEGMVGVTMVLGVKTSPFQLLVQGAGSAWRITARDFCKEFDRSPALLKCIDRYVFVMMSQLSANAACIRFHEIGPRLARWLLMTQDRAASESFRITHEFLSYMLGVRRVGITNAANALQRRGLIKYRRGELTVIDRQGLEGAACGCYATSLQSYARHLVTQAPRGWPGL